MPEPKPKDGRCCYCGNKDDTEETPCAKSPDGKHCEHWYDGPAEDEEARDHA